MARVIRYEMNECMSGLCWCDGCRKAMGDGVHHFVKVAKRGSYSTYMRLCDECNAKGTLNWVKGRTS